MSNLSTDILSSIFNVLSKEIITPSDFHTQVSVVKTMLANDLTGLVDSLTDFNVTSASVDFTIETESEEFTKILKKWLDNINRAYLGKIPSGINALSLEYFKERWKSSSFPVLKIAEWKSVNGVILPSKMMFVDGESIYAVDKNKDKEKTLLNYDYYLGKAKKHKLDDNVIFTRPYGRWFDKYPVPYLIKRGVYHNYKIIESLKNKETTVLNQVIPYLFLIKKGHELLDREGISVKDEDLQKIINQYKKVIEDAKAGKTPTRAAPWDEDIKHFIPDLEPIFKPVLFSVAEKAVLSGLGFIDVIEATSTSRRESILNPKVFIEETKKGVKDFKQLLKEIVNLIIDKNKSHIKYMNSDFRIVNSPITAFMTTEFKNHIRLLWERGQLSNKTYCSLVGEVEYQTEKVRREKEARNGDEFIMSPHQTQNQEQYESFEELEHRDLYPKDEDTNGKPIPTDKTDDKEKYKNAQTEDDLIGAPYRTIKALPDNVKKKLSPAKRKIWMDIFNKAYKFYLKKLGNAKKAETKAFQVAWSQIKQVKSTKKK